MDKNTLEFTVEQHHIDGGVCKAPGSCAIAMALKDTGFKDVLVLDKFIRVDGKGFVMDEDSKLFVINFDWRGMKNVSPARFKLDRIQDPYVESKLNEIKVLGG